MLEFWSDPSPSLSTLSLTCLLRASSTQLQESIVFCRPIWNPLAGDKELNILWEWPHLGFGLQRTYCEHFPVLHMGSVCQEQPRAEVV